MTYKQAVTIILFLTLFIWNVAYPVDNGRIPNYRTYYIDPLGDDRNNGLSPEKAWRSLERIGKAALKPGDTVLLRSGAIWKEPLIIPASGTAGNPIRFGRYGQGSRPLIDCTRDISSRVKPTSELIEGIRLNSQESGTNQVFLYGTRLNETKEIPDRANDYLIRKGLLTVRVDGSYVGAVVQFSIAVFPAGVLCKNQTDIILEDLQVSGSRGTPGLVSIINGERIRIRKCKVGNTRGFGIALASSSDILIENSEVHDCGLTGIGTDGSGKPSHHVQVINNAIHHIGYLAMDRFNDGHGIGVGNVPGCNNWFIEGNDIFESGRGGGTSYRDGGCGPAITCWETHDIVVRRNRIHDNYRGGISLELGGQSQGNRHEVSYNLIYRNGRNPSGKRTSGIGWSGIGVYKFVGNNTVDKISIINNTVTENYLGFAGACSSGIYLTVAGEQPMTNVLVANNIVYNNGTTNFEFWKRSSKVETTLFNNLFNRPAPGIIVNNDGQKFDINNFHRYVTSECKSCTSGNPRFVNSAKGDFRLRDNSPCRGKGSIISGFHEIPGVVDFSGKKLALNVRPSCGCYR